MSSILLSSLYICSKNGGVVVIFSFLLLSLSKTSEALKKRPKFWILDIKVCLKNLGIVSLNGKSVLDLLLCPGLEK